MLALARARLFHLARVLDSPLDESHADKAMKNLDSKLGFVVGASTTGSRSSRWEVSSLIAAGVVGLLATLAFLPILRNDFVASWDDEQNILSNRAFRGLGVANLQWACTTRLMGVYQPLAWILLEAQFVTFGLKPVGYHAVSLVLHAVNAILLFAVIQSLNSGANARRRMISSAFGATFWAVHPLRVETVAWVSCQPYLPCATLLLSSTLAYLRANQDRNIRRPNLYHGSLVFFVLAGLSKGLAMTFPFVLMILDVYPLRRFDLRHLTRKENLSSVLEKTPFCIVSLAVASAALWARYDSPSRRSNGLAERMMQLSYGLGYYLLKTVWPVGLSPFHFVPEPFDALEAVFIVSAAGMFVMAGMVIRLSKRWPAVGAVFLVYLVVVAPNLGFLPTSYVLVGDRYTYLATMSLFVLLASGMIPISERYQILVIITGIIVVVILTVLTWAQCRIWHDSQTLPWQSGLLRAVW
jgi:protein O-mannosyl-transferase